jgi:molecular chaperone GrpE
VTAAGEGWKKDGMTEEKETATDRAIREALESVERLERQAKGTGAEGANDAKDAKDAKDADDAAEEQAENVEILDPGSDLPPSGDPSDSSPEGPKKSASDALLEATLKAKAEMQEVLAQTQKEAKDLFDRLARVSADFDNFKKRVNREKQDAIKFANEGLFKEMLPVLDNLQRALASTAEPGSETSTIVEGVRLVAKQFEDVLGKMGVVGFPSLGEPFDPARHEAVGARPDERVPAQHVCEEYQRGYLLNDRLLRPALVIVSSGAPPEN